MLLELLRAANVPMAFLFSILPLDPSGNWRVTSKVLFALFGIDAISLFLFCRCQVVIKICEDANKLSVANSTCPECDARQMIVEYRPVKSYL